MTVYVTLVALPRNSVSAPTVPAWVFAAKPGSCQHSRTEESLEAAIAVRFRDGVVTVDSWADEMVIVPSRAKRKGTRENPEEYIVIYSLVVVDIGISCFASSW
jgi:hypothetical protein